MVGSTLASFFSPEGLLDQNFCLSLFFFFVFVHPKYIKSLGFHAPVFWFISPQRTFLFFSFWDTFLLSLSLGNILLSSVV